MMIVQGGKGSFGLVATADLPRRFARFEEWLAK